MTEEQTPGNTAPPPFDPAAELEYLLVGAKDGKVSIITVYQALLRAPLYAMFDRPIDVANLDTAANALLFATEEMGNLMVLFTAPEYSEKVRDDLGDFGHPGQFSGEYLVSVLSEDTGIILNPGHDHGMKVSATGLNRLKADFGMRGGPRPASQDQGPGGGPSFPSLE